MRGTALIKKWIVMAVLAMPFAAHAKAQTEGQGLTQDDRVWLERMAQGSAVEIKAGALAQNRGATDQVRDLGVRLERDHKKLLEQEKPVAKKLGVALKEQPTEEQKLATERLRKVDRQQFDAEFVKWQIQDHDTDIKMTEAAARSDNPEVRELATKALPVLREHEKLAKDAQSK